jgi:HSF-type DNA-binding
MRRGDVFRIVTGSSDVGMRRRLLLQHPYALAEHFLDTCCCTMPVDALNHLVEAAKALARAKGKVVQPAVTAKTTMPRIPLETFPKRLMAMLQNDSLSHVISWLSHGKAFMILRPDEFTRHVLPKFLPPIDASSACKFSSFTRKLNRWYVQSFPNRFLAIHCLTITLVCGRGFRQTTRGSDIGAFAHPQFCRDDPELCLQMTCQRTPIRRAAKHKDPTAQLQAVSTKTLPISSGKGPLKKRTSFVSPARAAPAYSTQFAKLTKESLDAHMGVVSDMSTMSSSSDQETLSEVSLGSSSSLSSLLHLVAPLNQPVSTNIPTMPTTTTDNVSCALTVLAAWIAAQNQVSAANVLATTLAQATAPPVFVAPPPVAPPALTTSQLAVLAAALMPPAVSPVATPVLAPIFPKAFSQVPQQPAVAPPVSTASQVAAAVVALIQQAFAPSQSPAVAETNLATTPAAPVQLQTVSCPAAAPRRRANRPSRMESVSKSLEIIQDKSFVENALKRRDEQERARVAQSLLLQSFEAVLQQQSKT